MSATRRLSTLVAMRGHRGLLLEREKYPRYQIAGEILRGREDDYRAFVRLVSGWSTSESSGATPAATKKGMDGPPRTLSEKSFGNAFEKSESGIFSMALGTAPFGSLSDRLVPSTDGLSWREAPR